MFQMSSVSEWYSGKNVFITGATGFMGKILIEKLLRSCQDIQKIYLLIRHKRGKSPKQRVDDLINIPVSIFTTVNPRLNHPFNFIRKQVFHQIRELPNGEILFGKLRCINGDVTQAGLGIADDDLTELRRNVDVVFHMAANVRFDQPLKQAMNFNTGGTFRLLEVVETFRQLKAFVHVSTSYCHCDETVLEEKLYSAPHNPR